LTSYLVLPLVQVALCLVLLPIVLRGHSRSTSHRLFALYLLGLIAHGSFIFLMRSSPTLEQAHYWDSAVLAIAPLVTIIIYHFSTVFGSISVKRWVLPLAYTVGTILFALSLSGLVVTGMQLKPYGYAPVGGAMLLITILFGYVFTIMAARNFLKAARSAPHPEERNRSAYIFTGLVLSMVGAAFDLLPVLGLPLYPGLIIGNIILYPT